jgi:hypothetical protein
MIFLGHSHIDNHHPEKLVKISIDAPYNNEIKSGGWGVICRDDMADICFAFASPVTTLFNPLCAEADALLKAIQNIIHIILALFTLSSFRFVRLILHWK